MNTNRDMEYFLATVAGLVLTILVASCSHTPKRFITDPSSCRTLHPHRVECEEWHPPMAV